MTTRTKYMTMFLSWSEEAANAAIETERGLGNRFAACVKELLNENTAASDAELVVLYDKAIEEMEAHVREKLVDAFDDEKCTLSKAFPEFRNYKSAYRSLLLKEGHAAAKLEKFGPYAVKQHLAALNKPKKQPDNKGPEAPTSDDGSTATPNAGHGGTAGGKTPEQAGLDPKVQAKIDSMVLALSKMSAEEAFRIASNADNAAWQSLKKGSRKLSNVTKAAA